VRGVPADKASRPHLPGRSAEERRKQIAALESRTTYRQVGPRVAAEAQVVMAAQMQRESAAAGSRLAPQSPADATPPALLD